MKWKCMICGKMLKPAFDEQNVEEHLPALIDGGTVQIDFGYGSKHDALTKPGVWQAAIHDECFDKCKHLFRRVLVQRNSQFKVINGT